MFKTMNPSRKKKDDIETKARLSAFKAKQRNDYEDRLLSLQLRQLHTQTVSSLAEHWKSTMEVVNIFKGCHQTSGISPLGIIPEENDAEGCANDIPGKTTPWAYFRRFSINSWYKPEQERLKRPQTVGPCIRSKQKDTLRPNTAPELKKLDTNADKSSNHPESTKKKIQKTEESDEVQRTKVIQLQAKAMTMTRSKFLDLENLGPIYNRNLAVMLRKRPSRPGHAHTQRVNSNPEEPLRFQDRVLDMRLGSRNRDSKEAWDLNCVRQHLMEYGVTSSVHDDKKSKDKQRVMADSSALAQRIKMMQKSGDDSEDDLFEGYHKKLRLRRRHSSKRPKSHPHLTNPNETAPKPGSGNEDNKEYVDMICRLNRQPVTHSQHFEGSKFYIPPQERYRMEQQFLMKRYFFLQRQMNKNHDVEASILAKAQTALVVTPNSSRSARLKMLAALTKQNAAQQKVRRRFDGDEAIRNKVQAFLDNVAAFIRRTMPEESHTVVPTGQEEQLNSPKIASLDETL